MRKTKKEKGITLLALIITIVVLLILASVTIGAIKNSGIITHSQNASNDYTIAQEKEQIQLALSEWQIQKNIPDNNKTFKDVITSELANVADVSGENNNGPLTVTFNKTQNTYNVTEDGKINLISSNGKDDDGEQQLGKATVGKKVSKNSTINGKAYSSDNPIIPAGFMAINVTTEGHESYWDAEDGPQVSEGLVISDGNSEFVWIPVEDGILPSVSGSEPEIITRKRETTSYEDGADMDSVYLAKAGITEGVTEGISEENSKIFLNELTDKNDKMRASVVEYEGFYVGRYEVSYNSKTQKAESVKGAISANETDSTSNTWYGLYALCKTYNSVSVTSNMMWGCQYEAIMEFIGNDKEKNEGRNTSRVTGSIETDRIKNIYDLMGNSAEWTTAVYYGTMRVYRGGSYEENSEGKPNVHGSDYPTEGKYDSCGSRMTLVIRTTESENVKDNEKVMPVATVGKVVDENSTINGKKYSSKNPVIPKGFKAINVTTERHKSSWDAEGGPQVLEGLVISDGNSEFVWIPVSDIDTFARTTAGTDVNENTNYQGVLYDFSGKTATEMLNYGLGTTSYREPANSAYDNDTKISIWTPTLYQESFNKMVKSVAEYGGFYVGRYETSMNGSIAQSKAGETALSTAWFTMYSNSLTYSKNGLKSEMIWGCQWDAMMNFILRGTEGNYVTSSSTSDIMSNIYYLNDNYEYTQESYSSDCKVYRSGAKRGNTYGNNYNNSSRLAIYVEV